MANGYNPYQGGNIQNIVQSYGDQGLQRSKNIQNILLQKSMQGKHIKKVEKGLKKIRDRMNRKRRRRGFLGGLLSLGSMFIPGGKWWLKPLIGAITKGGVTLSTEDMLKKEKDRIDKMKKGTLADKLVSAYSDIARDEISSLDPVKAAVESFAADAILQAGAKSISKGKEAKELPKVSDSSIGIKPDVDLAYGDYGEPSGLTSPEFISPEVPKPSLAETSVNPYSRNITIDKASAPDVYQPKFQQAVSPSATNRQLAESGLGTRDLVRLLASYGEGAGAAYGKTALSDADLLASLIAQIQGGE